MKKSISIYCSYFLLGFLVVEQNVYGQVQDSVLQNKIAIDSILAIEQLSKLEGRPTTFYSKGHEVRARAIHDFVRSCILFYENQFPGKRFDLRVYVLNKNDWERAPFGNPYGLIGYYPNNILEIIPADKNAQARLVGAPDDPIKTDSIISGYDAGALHEMGHYFFETLNGIVREHWLNEVMATYFALSYLKAKEKHIATGIEEMLKVPLPQPKYKSLQDFQNLYLNVGPANYDWYQRRFAQLDFALYPKLKLELIKEVIENYSPGGKNLDGISLLKKLAPETMNEWLKEMH